MAITLTEAAAKHIRNQIQKRGNGIALRIGVKKSGCSGFAYTFGIAEEIYAADTVVEGFGAKVLIDAESLPFLDGTELAYVKEGLGHVFRFNNPNAKNQCGCGESFAV